MSEVSQIFEDRSQRDQCSIGLSITKRYLIALAMLCALVPAAEAAADDLPGALGPVRENATWVTLPSGKQALDLKWARGHSGDIAILRIPKAYVGPLMGPGNCHPFSPTAVDPNCQFDFAVTAIVRAELPSLTEPPAVPDFLTTQILLTSTGLPESKSVASVIQVELQTQLSFVRATGGKLRSLSRAGLNGLGLTPTPGMVAGNIPIRPNIYFNASSPDLASAFLACPDDEISRLISPSMLVGDDATCVEYFAIPGLEAGAEMQVPVKYLDSWNQIADSTVTLLNSFLLGE